MINILAFHKYEQIIDKVLSMIPTQNSNTKTKLLIATHTFFMFQGSSCKKGLIHVKIINNT